MNQDIFAKKVAGYLEAAAREVDASTTHRLRMAREKAMGRYSEPVRLLGLVPVATSMAAYKQSVREHPIMWLAPVVAALALGIFAVVNDDAAELGELDAAILSSDIPINALVDRDFNNLLKPDQ